MYFPFNTFFLITAGLSVTCQLLQKTLWLTCQREVDDECAPFGDDAMISGLKENEHKLFG